VSRDTEASLLRRTPTAGFGPTVWHDGRFVEWWRREAAVMVC